MGFISWFIISFWEKPLIQALHFCNNLMATEISLFLKQAIYKEFQSLPLLDINVPIHTVELDHNFGIIRCKKFLFIF